ncbi:MAG: CRISPR system precrRNA processing endoribonuclease RAMP protein Cas6, partial [Gammaproteobacteria bacterium]|nr:CRISPR system precrRNA processing endoribonuclease RAMP protein Cas6 [Gammaproteobacteria bacterium]
NVLDENLWRGAFGKMLRDQSCLSKMDHCGQCPLRNECIYSRVFEPAPPPNTKVMRLYNQVPRPFVLRTVPAAKLGQHIIEISLFGDTVQYLGAVLNAFVNAARAGISKQRLRFELKDILQAKQLGVKEEWSSVLTNGLTENLPNLQIPTLPEIASFEFTRPIILKQNSQILTDRQIEFHHLFGSLLRRLFLLRYFYGQQDVTNDDSLLVDRSKTAKFMNRNLYWVERTRYSYRQNKEIPMAGVIGSCSLPMCDNTKVIWPLLWVGQWVHVGKGTTLGMGQYRLS